MASLYWVGGTAAWDGTAGTKWALTSGGAGGQPIPTTADDVFFDGNSGASTVTISTGNTGAKSINCTGFTGTLTGTAAITVAGSVTLVAGMSYTHTGTMTFSGTGTLVTAGKTFSAVTLNGAGITLTQGDALNMVARTLNLIQGTFDTAGYALTANIISASGSNTIVLNLNASTANIGSFNTAIATAMTINAGTSQLNITNLGASLLVVSATFYNVSFTSTDSSTRQIGGILTFNNLSITAPSGIAAANMLIANNITINGTLTCAGSSAVNRLFLLSNIVGATRTLTVNTLSATDCDFRDITIAGTAAGTSVTRGGDCGGNSGITFPAAKTVYWNVATGGNWTDTAWATSSGGAVNINNFPLAQDTAVIDATGLNSGATITINASVNIGSLNMSARTANTMTLAAAASPNIHGNITFGTGVTNSGTFNWIFAGRSTMNLTSAGVVFLGNLAINCANGTLKLLDAFTSNRSASTAVIFTSGTIDLNGFTLTLTGASSGLSATAGSATRVINFNGGNFVIAGINGWNVAGANFSVTGTGGGTINLTNAGSKTFAGGSNSYSNITLNNGGAGAMTITGNNTIGTLSNSVQPTTFRFTAGTTTTITNWSVNGTSGNLVTITSATTATHTLSKASGTVSADYLSISYSVATGGATWNAGANSTDGGNNSGWIFGAPSPGTKGNFLLVMGV